MKFRPLLQMADQLHVVQVRAEERGLPQQPHGDVHAQTPLRGQRFRHAHALSIWKGGKPLFAGDKYAGLSQMALTPLAGS